MWHASVCCHLVHQFAINFSKKHVDELEKNCQVMKFFNKNKLNNVILLSVYLLKKKGSIQDNKIILFIFYHKQNKHEIWKFDSLKNIWLLDLEPQIYKNVGERGQARSTQQVGATKSSGQPALTFEAPATANTGRFACVKFLTRGGSTDSFLDIRRPKWILIICLITLSILWY